MKTRSQRLRRERAGLPSSPPQHLPATIQRRARAPRKKTPAIKPNAMDNSNDTNSEASAFPLRSLHPVPVRSNSRERVSPAGEADLKISGGVPNTPGSPTSSTVATPVAVSPVVKIAGPNEQYSLIFVLENPRLEELASLRPLNTDSLISLVTLADNIPGVFNWIQGGAEPCGHDRLTNSPVSTQVSPSLKKRELSDQIEITQSARSRLNDPPVNQEISQQPTEPEQIEPVGQEISERAEETQSDTETETDKTYATRRRPRDWRTLPLQILEAAKLPNAKTPRDDQVPPITVYERVDRYAKDGSLQFGLKAVTYTSAEVVPPNPLLASKGPSASAQRVAKNLLSERHNHSPSAEHGSDSDSASERDSIQSGSVCAQEPMLKASAKAPQPAPEPVPLTPRNRWGFDGWIKTARSVTKFISNFNHLSPVPEQPQTEPKVSLPAVPVSPNVMKDRRHRSKNLSSRSKKSFRTKDDVQISRTKQAERASIRAQVKAAKEVEFRIAKDAEALKEAQQKAEMATTPGQKRKRVPSPDTIPNPKGCSYGMDLDYFGYDSSDEDEEPITTPSKQPNKIRRTGGPEEPTRSRVIGDPKRAQPYVGVYFGNSRPEYHGGNVFEEARATDEAKRRAEALKNAPTIPRSRVFAKEDRERKEREEKGWWPAPPATPRSWDVPPLTPIHATGKFRVPSPTDSDSDLETSGIEVSPEVKNPVSPKRASKSSRENDPAGSVGRPSSAKLATPTAKKASVPTTKTSSSTRASNIALPSAAGASEVGALSGPPQTTHLSSGASMEAEALRKARNKALQHKPRTPSSLSQSSRISFSPMGAVSEEGNQSPVQNASVTQPSSGSGAVNTTSQDSQPFSVSNTITTTKAHAETQPSNVTNAVPIILQTAVSPKPKKFNASEEYLKTAHKSIEALLANTPVDLIGAGEAFTEAVMYDAVNERGVSQGAAVPNTQSGVSNTNAAGTPPSKWPIHMLQPFTPLDVYGITPVVQEHIIGTWGPEDEVRSGQEFVKNLRKHVEIHAEDGPVMPRPDAPPPFTTFMAI